MAGTSCKSRSSASARYDGMIDLSQLDEMLSVDAKQQVDAATNDGWLSALEWSKHWSKTRSIGRAQATRKLNLAIERGIMERGEKPQITTGGAVRMIPAYRLVKK